MSFNQIKVIEEANFGYSPLGTYFEKQAEKQVDILKYLYPSNELKQINGIFPQNLMNDFICTMLKQIIELQDIIKKEYLKYKSKCRKTYNFGKHLLSLLFN